ncbi:hypothetical protein OGAPHI_006890 [Ogataea philodendri]|uniref:4-nitrophenylphosphatase n=1 Tax=Ogataea philodendri TaxID=1378263 RepID=A0A9P8SZP0_9ASCO|nr:uncharacterized protein OGAPHI_006890 [Ogataea philodendri]KAH3660304.1 hypothetical protein OGAPHI_006890 [Ogataea philodendri]
MSVKIATKTQVETVLDKYDTFLFDCDGVLWLGNHLLPSVVETLTLLRSHGKKVIFVTNNSTKSRADYVHKFEKFGIKASSDEIFSSSYATAVYVDSILKLPKDKKVWVLGGSGIQDELKLVGYESIGGSDPTYNKELDLDDPESPIYHLDPQVGAVVVGLDTKINYFKSAVTMQYLNNPEIPFLATNIDSTYPHKGLKLPGAGTCVETIACASGRKPLTSCGKPNPSMMDAIVKAHKIDRSRSIMVGDRLNTDMKFGREGGLATLLVLTGIETVQTLNQLEKDVQPTYYSEKLGDLFELLQ